MSTRRPPEITDEQIRDALTRRPDPGQMADDLAFIVATVERTRQRRWLPARLASGMAPMRPAAALLALLAVLVALAIALGVVVGSHQRLPPPFGLAKPGLIAFDQGGDTYVANPDGSARTKLTSSPGADVRPTWSPDGTAIAYASRSLDLSWAVIVMGADGRRPVVVADDFLDLGDIAWSPDSRRLAFAGQLLHSAAPIDPNTKRIYIGDADRPGAIQIGGPDLFGVGPSWSPNGAQIAFKRLFPPCCGSTGEPALWVMGADGSSPHRLSSMAQAPNSPASDNAFLDTAWAPDGKRLAFLAPGNGPVTRRPGLAFDVYVINADGTGEVNISDSQEEEYWPSWSPDGARVAFARASTTVDCTSETGNIPRPCAATFVVVDPDGSHPVTLTGALVNSDPAVWSPDGTRLLGYVWNPDIESNSAIVVFDSSGRTPPTTIPVDGFNSASWQRLAP